jgi:hypothetical protein
MQRRYGTELPNFRAAEILSAMEGGKTDERDVAQYHSTAWTHLVGAKENFRKVPGGVVLDRSSNTGASAIGDSGVDRSRERSSGR